jgi:hypothetical protein
MAPMMQSEAWRLAYRKDRYLRSAEIGSLERRSQDINHAMMNVNAEGQITAPTSLYWWELFAHILEELELRSIDYHSLNLADVDAMSWISAPQPPRGLEILGKRKLPSADFLSRVGQRDHIKGSFEKGRFRIAPASSYTDPSLNPAIQDEELTVTAIGSGDAAIVTTYDPKTGKSGKPIPVVGEISYSQSTPDNFFVLCMSNGYQPRILDDFEADALLVVHNVNRFLIRLERAVKAVRPDLRMLARPITYYDPYRVNPDQVEPEFSKHFRFSYQREYRIIWQKIGLGFDEQPFFVEIGNLKEIASIYLSQP